MSRSTRALDTTLGLVYLAVGAALVLLAVLVYQKAFTSSIDVELSTGTVGNALRAGSDVTLHGVPVGEVTSIRSTADGAVLTLALQPETADRLPPSTTARLLPRTLFGERYVSLVTDGVAGPGLGSGDRIRQDTSDEAVELEQLFDELLPLLRSIQPEKLSAALGELATALRGRGEQIGDTLVDTGAYLERLNPQVPRLTEDLGLLAEVADVYADAAPDLLDALDTLTTTSATLVDRREGLVEVYARVIGASDAAEGFVSDQRETIVVLADESRAALEAVRPYAAQLPCLFSSVRDFIPRMDAALGAGTGRPGLRVDLRVTRQRGAYEPGRDAVRYTTGGGPRCPYVQGRVGTRPAAATGDEVPETIAPPPSPLVRDRIAGAADLGAANSPAENRLIAELEAPARGLSIDDYPAWASLLVGPTLRGTDVVLR